MKEEWSVLLKSLKDYGSRELLKFALLPFLVSAFLLFGLFWGAADMGLDALDGLSVEYHHQSQSVENGELSTELVHIKEEGMSALRAVLGSTVGVWVISLFVYGLGAVVVGMVSIYTALVVVGFLTPWIVRAVHKKGWEHIALEGSGTLLGALGMLLKQTAVMVGLFIVLIPLYFVPLVNVIAFNVPLFYFFHRMLHYDVASEMMRPEQRAVITLHTKGRLRFRSLLLYLLSMLPFVWLFIPVFYIVYVANGYFSALEQESPTPEA